MSPTFDTPGLLARSVADIAYGFAALDPKTADPLRALAEMGGHELAGVRIGVGDPFLWRGCDPGIAEAVEEATAVLARRGAVLRERILPEAAACHDVFLAGGLSAIELRAFLEAELPQWLHELDPVIAEPVRAAETLSAREYLARRHRLQALAGAVGQRFAGLDVIAMPTLCVAPPLMVDVDDPGRHLRVNRRIVRNTVWVNYCGLCAITLPVALDRSGLPVGMQLVAPPDQEERLLAIALAAERVLGTAAERLGTPPLLA